MTDDRSSSGLVGRRFRKSGPAPVQATPDSRVEPAGRRVPSKVLPKLLGLLGHRDHPTLLDLGPVIGSNVTFFGERLGCRLIVEDLYSDVERFARDGRMGELPAFLAGRLDAFAYTCDRKPWDVWAGEVMALEQGLDVREEEDTRLLAVMPAGWWETLGLDAP